MVFIFFYNDARIKSINTYITVENSGHFSISGISTSKILSIHIVDYYKVVYVTNHNSSFRIVETTSSGSNVVASGTKIQIVAYYID